ncbi:MAG: NAD(P)H-dependent oxidoreductase [Anaerolineaceae bacterium]
MRILCISASNVERARDHSASLRTCALIRDLIQTEAPEHEVILLPLLDIEMNPCRMCGGCVGVSRCKRDPQFNSVLEACETADAVFLVCPHYAPLPSKVMMMLEKMEEIVFLNGSVDEQYRFPLAGKPIGIIAHGGQTSPGAIPYYRSALLEPLANAFRSTGMQVIPAADNEPDGAVFGIQKITLPEGEIFVRIEHDWDAIRVRLIPLVRAVLNACTSRH